MADRFIHIEIKFEWRDFIPEDSEECAGCGDTVFLKGKAGYFRCGKDDWAPARAFLCQSCGEAALK